MIISGKYFATGDQEGRVSMTVERRSPPGESVEGIIINGAWRGTFTATEVTVHATNETFPVSIIWQGDELFEQRSQSGGWMATDYGFTFVRKEIAAGRTGLEAAA